MSKNELKRVLSGKVLIDGMLYIVKDGKIYDATGSLIK